MSSTANGKRVALRLPHARVRCRLFSPVRSRPAPFLPFFPPRSPHVQNLFFSTTAPSSFLLAAPQLPTLSKVSRYYRFKRGEQKKTVRNWRSLQAAQSKVRPLYTLYWPTPRTGAQFVSASATTIVAHSRAALHSGLPASPFRHLPFASSN